MYSGILQLLAIAIAVVATYHEISSYFDSIEWPWCFVRREGEEGESCRCPRKEAGGAGHVSSAYY
jgi:hypothetical protein